MSKQDAFAIRRKHMQRIRELSAQIDPYIIDDDAGSDCGIMKLQQDAPTEIKEAYDEYLRLIHVGTSEDRKMLGTWFQTIKPYGVFKGRALAGIREDAPSEAKDAYEKLKRSRIRVWESGAVVK